MTEKSESSFRTSELVRIMERRVQRCWTATKNEFKKYELKYEYGLVVLPLSLSDFKLSVGGPSFLSV